MLDQGRKCISRDALVLCALVYRMIYCHGVCGSLSDGEELSSREGNHGILLWLREQLPALPHPSQPPGCADRQNSGGQGGGNPNHHEGLSEGPAKSFQGFASRGCGPPASLSFSPGFLHCPAGAPSAHLSRLKRAEQPSPRNREHTEPRNEGPTLSLPVESRAWGREGNSQGALPCSAVDWSPLKDETCPILPAEWSAQRPFEGKGRKTARSPRGLLSGERLPSNREMKRSRGWQRAWRWGEADQTNFCYGISGEVEVKASFEMSRDNECYFTPMAEVSDSGLEREGVILPRNSR